MFRSSEGGGGIGVRSVTTTTRPSIEEYDVSIRILGSFRNRNLRPLPEIGEVSPPEQGGGEEFAATPPPTPTLATKTRTAVEDEEQRKALRSADVEFSPPSIPISSPSPSPSSPQSPLHRAVIGRDESTI